MIIYYLYFCFIGILSLTNLKRLTITFLILFTCFYYEIGMDWNSYLAMYDNNIKLEPLYYMIQALSFYCGSFQYLIFFIELIYIALFCKSIEKYSNYFGISVLIWLGVDYLSFGVLRQIVAIAIFFYSIIFIVNRNFMRYFVCCCIAIGFHYSAIILFPLYFILNHRFGNIKILIITIFSFVAYYTHFISNYINNIFSYFFISKAAYYLGDEKMSANLGLGVRFYEILIVFSVCILYRKILEKKYEYFNVFFNCIFCLLVVYLCLNSTVVFAVRFIKYFEIAYIIIIPYAISIIKEKKDRYIVACLAIIYYYTRYHITIVGIFSQQDNYAAFVPYKNIIVSFVNNLF